MARQDFYLEFGSNAEQFGGQLQKDLADTHNELNALAEQMEVIDASMARRTGGGGVTAIVEGLGEANQLIQTLVSSLDRMGGEFQSIADNTRVLLSNLRNIGGLPNLGAGGGQPPPPPPPAPGTGGSDRTISHAGAVDDGAALRANIEGLQQQYIDLERNVREAQALFDDATTSTGKARKDRKTDKDFATGELEDARRRQELIRQSWKELQEQQGLQLEKLDDIANEALAGEVFEFSAQPTKAPAKKATSGKKKEPRKDDKQAEEVRAQAQADEEEFQERLARVMEERGLDREAFIEEILSPDTKINFVRSLGSKANLGTNVQAGRGANLQQLKAAILNAMGVQDVDNLLDDFLVREADDRNFAAEQAMEEKRREAKETLERQASLKEERGQKATKKGGKFVPKKKEDAGRVKEISRELRKMDPSATEAFNFLKELGEGQVEATEEIAEQAETQTTESVKQDKEAAREAVEQAHKAREAIWKNKDVDQPVTVTGSAGTLDGREFVTVEGSSTAIPLDEIEFLQEVQEAETQAKEEVVEQAVTESNETLDALKAEQAALKEERGQISTKHTKGRLKGRFVAHKGQGERLAEIKERLKELDTQIGEAYRAANEVVEAKVEEEEEAAEVLEETETSGEGDLDALKAEQAALKEERGQIATKHTKGRQKGKFVAHKGQSERLAEVKERLKELDVQIGEAIRAGQEAKEEAEETLEEEVTKEAPAKEAKAAPTKSVQDAHELALQEIRDLDAEEGGLEALKRDELAEMTKELGISPGSRARKSEHIDALRDAAGRTEPDDEDVDIDEVLDAADESAKRLVSKIEKLADGNERMADALNLVLQMAKRIQGPDFEFQDTDDTISPEQKDLIDIDRGSGGKRAGDVNFRRNEMGAGGPLVDAREDSEASRQVQVALAAEMQEMAQTLEFLLNERDSGDSPLSDEQLTTSIDAAVNQISAIRDKIELVAEGSFDEGLQNLADLDLGIEGILDSIKQAQIVLDTTDEDQPEHQDAQETLQMLKAERNEALQKRREFVNSLINEFPIEALSGLDEGALNLPESLRRPQDPPSFAEPGAGPGLIPEGFDASPEQQSRARALDEDLEEILDDLHEARTILEEAESGSQEESDAQTMLSALQEEKEALVESRNEFVRDLMADIPDSLRQARQRMRAAPEEDLPSAQQSFRDLLGRGGDQRLPESIKAVQDQRGALTPSQMPKVEEAYRLLGEQELHNADVAERRAREMRRAANSLLDADPSMGMDEIGKLLRESGAPKEARAGIMRAIAWLDEMAVLFPDQFTSARQEGALARDPVHLERAEKAQRRQDQKRGITGDTDALTRRQKARRNMQDVRGGLRDTFFEPQQTSGAKRGEMQRLIRRDELAAQATTPEQKEALKQLDEAVGSFAAEGVKAKPGPSRNELMEQLTAAEAESGVQLDDEQRRIMLELAKQGAPTASREGEDGRIVGLAEKYDVSEAQIEAEKALDARRKLEQAESDGYRDIVRRHEELLEALSGAPDPEVMAQLADKKLTRDARKAVGLSSEPPAKKEFAKPDPDSLRARLGVGRQKTDPARIEEAEAGVDQAKEALDTAEADHEALKARIEEAKTLHEEKAQAAEEAAARVAEAEQQGPPESDAVREAREEYERLDKAVREAAQGIGDMSHRQLQTEAKEHGVSAGGKKGDLQKRVRAARTEELREQREGARLKLDQVREAEAPTPLKDMTLKQLRARASELEVPDRTALGRSRDAEGRPQDARALLTEAIRETERKLPEEKGPVDPKLAEEAAQAAQETEVAAQALETLKREAAELTEEMRRLIGAVGAREQGLMDLKGEDHRNATDDVRRFDRVNQAIADVESGEITKTRQVPEDLREGMRSVGDEAPDLEGLMRQRLAMMVQAAETDAHGRQVAGFDRTDPQFSDTSITPDEFFRRFEAWAQGNQVTPEQAADERFAKDQEFEASKADELAAAKETIAAERAAMEKAKAARKTTEGAGGFKDCCERIVAALERIQQVLQGGVKISGTKTKGPSTRTAKTMTRDQLLDEAKDLKVPRRHEMKKEDLAAAIEAERELQGVRGATAESTEEASKEERLRQIQREELPPAAQKLLEGADQLEPEDAIQRAAEFTKALKNSNMDLGQARSIAGQQFGLDDEGMERLKARYRALEQAGRAEAEAREAQSRTKQDGTRAENELLEHQQQILANLSPDTRSAVQEARRLSALSGDDRPGDQQIQDAQARAITLMDRDFEARRDQGRIFAPGQDRNREMRGMLGASGPEFTDAHAQAQGMQFARQFNQAVVQEGPNVQKTVSDAFFGESGFMARSMRSVGTFMVRNMTSGLVFGMTRMFRQMIKDALETEAQFIRISDALEATGRSAEGVRTSLMQISVDLGRPLQEVFEIASNITGAFDSVADVEFGTRIVAQLELISQGALSAKNGFDALQTIASSFELEGVSELERIQDTAVAIQNVMAIGVNDTIEGIGGIAGQAAELNMALEETAVLVAAVAKGTNQGGKAAAEQFGRILSTFETARGRNVLLESDVGNRGMFAEGDIGAVVIDMIESWDDLTEAQQRNIKATFGSRREARAFNALINRREQILQTLIETENAHGLGQQRVEEVMREIANQIKVAGTNFTNFGAILVRSGMLDFFGLLLRTTNTVVGGFNSFLSMLNDLADRNPLANFARTSIALMLGLAAAIKGVGVAADAMAKALASQAIVKGSLATMATMPILGPRIAAQAAAKGEAVPTRMGGAAAMGGAFLMGGTGRRVAGGAAASRTGAFGSLNEMRRLGQGPPQIGRPPPPGSELNEMLLAASLLGAGGLSGGRQPGRLRRAGRFVGGLPHRGTQAIGGVLQSAGGRLTERAGAMGAGALGAGAAAKAGGALTKTGAAAKAGGALTKLGAAISAIGAGPAAAVAAALLAIAGGIAAIHQAGAATRSRGEDAERALMPLLSDERAEEIAERRRQDNLGFFARFTERGKEARQEEEKARFEELQAMSPGERMLEESRDQTSGFGVRVGNILRGSFTTDREDVRFLKDIFDDAVNRVVPEETQERVGRTTTTLRAMNQAGFRVIREQFGERADTVLDEIMPMLPEAMAEGLRPGAQSRAIFDDEQERLLSDMDIDFFASPRDSRGGTPPTLGEFGDQVASMFDIDEDDGGRIDIDESQFVSDDQAGRLAEVAKMREAAVDAFMEESEDLEESFARGRISETEFQARSAALIDAREKLLDDIGNLERGVLDLREVDRILSQELTAFIDAVNLIEGLPQGAFSSLEGVADALDIVFEDLDALPEESSWAQFLEDLRAGEMTEAEQQEGIQQARQDLLDEAVRNFNNERDDLDPEEIDARKAEIEQLAQTVVNGQQELWDNAVNTAGEMAQIAAEIGGGSTQVAEESIQRGIDAINEQLGEAAGDPVRTERLLAELRTLGQMRVDIEMGPLDRESALADARSDDSMASAQRASALAQRRLAASEREAARLGLSGEQRDAFIHDALLSVYAAQDAEADAISNLADAEVQFAQLQTEDPREAALIGVQGAIDALDRYDGEDQATILRLEGEIIQARRAQRDAIDQVARAEMEFAISETQDPREQALIRLRDAVRSRALYEASGGDDPGEIASRDAAINSAERELLQQARAERDSVAQTRIAMERDPEQRLLMEMQVARIQLAEAAEEGRAAVEAARQNLIQLEQSLEDQRNQIRLGQFQMRISTTEDPLIAARLQVQAAQEEMRQAVGALERQSAIQSIVAARQAEADAVAEVADSQLQLASAIAQAHGNQIEAGRIALEQARNQLRQARARGMGDAAIAQAQAGVIQAEAAMRDAVLQDQLDTIEFNREMGVITQGEAIGALNEILQTMDLTRDQRRGLLRQIRGLQDDLRAQLTGSGFNIPTEIDLPTAYQVRRSLGIDEMRTDRLPEEWAELAEPRVDIDADLTEPLSAYEDAVGTSTDRVVVMAREGSKEAIAAIMQEYETLAPRMSETLQALATAQNNAWIESQKAAETGAMESNRLSLEVISELPPSVRAELDGIIEETTSSWAAATAAADEGSRAYVDAIMENIGGLGDFLGDFISGFYDLDGNATNDGGGRRTKDMHGFRVNRRESTQDPYDVLHPSFSVDFNNLTPAQQRAVDEAMDDYHRSGPGTRFARGGFLPDDATIQPGQGDGLVQWAEGSTGGEAFIPLGQANRPRSIDIWQETGRRLGVESFARGGIRGFDEEELELIPQLLDETAGRVARRTSPSSGDGAEMRQLMQGIGLLTSASGRSDTNVSIDNTFNQAVQSPAQVQQVARAVVELLNKQAGAGSKIRAASPRLIGNL